MRVRISDAKPKWDEIKLRDFTVHCTIGIYPEEKLRTQELLLNISLFLDTRAAAQSGTLAKTVDYATLARQLEFILQHARFRLLESAVAALSAFILNPPEEQGLGLIEAVDIEIIKPEALGELATPSLRIFRTRTELANLHRASRQLLFSVPEASIERWTLEPQEILQVESSQREPTFLMPESNGLQVDRKAVNGPQGFALTRPLLLENCLTEKRSVLVVSSRQPRPRRAAAQAEVDGPQKGPI